MENAEKPTKSMTEFKISILEIVINSPVACDKTQEEFETLLNKAADFVFVYNPKKNDLRN